VDGKHGGCGRSNNIKADGKKEKRDSCYPLAVSASPPPPRIVRLISYRTFAKVSFPLSVY